MMMDWSKTKTIFIIAFLILDIFLALQYMEKMNENKYDIITETTIEEQFKAEDIKYGKLPTKTIKGSYITAKSKQFTQEEIDSLKNQELMLRDEELIKPVTQLRMSFIEPIQLPDNNMENKLKQILTTQIIQGSQYRYWRYDENDKEIIFLQVYKGYAIFQDENDGIGMIVFYLNDHNEITSYRQTLLEDIKELENQDEVIKAIRALEALYDKNYLKPKSTVTKVEYGYYTQIPLTEQQILAPTWHIVVNDQEDFYVNALEGDIIKPEKSNLE
jgi:regulatory protein YycI of two-component signal transduction system YycFG